MTNEGLSASTQLAWDFNQDTSFKGEAAANQDHISLPCPDFFPRKSRPTPSEVFGTFWEFAARRQAIFFARLEGDSAQAPQDPIIARHRFTNVYRASDRVSQYLIRRVIYGDNWSNEDLFFRIILFKLFNKIETWEALETAIGKITWEGFSFDRYDKLLSSLMDNGHKIYSAAYIMPSGKSSFGHARKHQNHLCLIAQMMSGHLPDRIAQQPSLQGVFDLLRTFPCIGPFTGYQYTIDLNYSPLVNFSENDFVEAGPGALDGIAKCFVDPGDYTPAEIISYMTDVQFTAFERYAPEFRNLWGRPLHKIDCQNLFCEVDKYARVAHPTVAGHSGRSRIKQIYRESHKDFERPFYPPKWQLRID